MYAIKQEHKEKVLNFFKGNFILSGCMAHDDVLASHICDIVREDGFTFVINKEHCKSGKNTQVELSSDYFVELNK